MYHLLQFIGVFVIFLLSNYFTWWFTEKANVPEFLEYAPFSCRLCLTFWLLVGIYIAIGISYKLWIVLIAGIILAALNAIAMWVNQKNKTVKIEDLDDEIIVDDEIKDNINKLLAE